ncbi:hypothetical protein EJ110_NYTH55733 [Nymphaea thermarum]|nr:hypothetical protein EJ110_NYTH55733 [Nymphaea thermarum]
MENDKVSDIEGWGLPRTGAESFLRKTCERFWNHSSSTHSDSKEGEVHVRTGRRRGIPKIKGSC